MFELPVLLKKVKRVELDNSRIVNQSNPIHLASAVLVRVVLHEIETNIVTKRNIATNLQSYFNLEVKFKVRESLL